MIRVSVWDNGPGFSSVGGAGVGLSNVRQRLEVIYGQRVAQSRRLDNWRLRVHHRRARIKIRKDLC
jgi:signal transduction histidine kinase